MPTSSHQRVGQAGFSYTEMLIATALVMAGIGPALGSLQRAQLGAAAHVEETQRHYRLLGRLEELLAQPYEVLLAAAATAGSATTPSAFSDPPAEPDRIVIYLSYYDLADDDSDGDFFTIADADGDNDNDPYTGPDVDIETLWVRAETAGSGQALEALTRRSP